MLFDDTYRTIAELSEGEFKDRGSKFLAFLYPIEKESEVKELLERLRTQHPKARHFCWAWRLSPDRTIFRINDDGEPSGTAGRPILNALLSQDITDVLAVVVRYFGGSLLGVPGLINAYKSAVQDALSRAPILEKTVNSVYEWRFPPERMNDVMRIIKEEDLKLLSNDYDQGCVLEVEIRQLLIQKVLDRLQTIHELKARFITNN